ncbi:Major facilitator superfamily MFS_1 [Candidatus Promineifilum breve]|uniref:Major facilitator superfamily MFS_1 n=1 Tax=Candidatus Promineifilum breve TaxID=1806508 RepID=A0A160T279_9CHLR|nr:MFS transporter [Candidatus Promineifilum breve]CUS04016.2 Major facilitator superfamily MFS_1 [Candidatus Promineifilum breve]
MSPQSKKPSVWSRLPALHSRDYRLMWFGLFVSTVGSQMQFTAVNWHIFELLRGQIYTLNLFGRVIDLGAEALGLGTLGLVRVIPIILFALAGGLLADTRNRRTLLIYTQLLSLFFAGALAFLTFTGRVTIPLIYLLTAALAGVHAFEQPSRQSLIPHLVPAAAFANAVSLNTLMFTGAGVIGPALGGILLAYAGVQAVYLVNAISFLAVVVSLAFLAYRGQAAVSAAGLGWGALLEGLRFTFRTPMIWSTMMLDFLATFFSSARTMLPIVAGDILGLGPVGYGWLSAAQPVGSIVAGSVTALNSDMKRQGVVLLVSVLIYGAATAFFGLTTSFILAFFFLALTGASDTVSTVIRGTLRQLMTPDELRGRMTSVNMVFFMGGPQLGELEAGLAAAAFGVPFAIVSGGIATVLLTLLIAWKYPVLRRFDRPVAVTATA